MGIILIQYNFTFLNKLLKLNLTVLWVYNFLDIIVNFSDTPKYPGQNIP